MSEKFTGILLKADTPDSNGRIYSKEALEKVVKEYNKNHTPNTTPVHKMSMKVVKAKVEIDKYVFEKPISRCLKMGYKRYWDYGGTRTIKDC